MMKEVILSHDSEAKIYLVPDEVSDNLDTYCWNFAANWLWQSPHAKKYHKIVCYSQHSRLTESKTKKFGKDFFKIFFMVH